MTKNSPHVLGVIMARAGSKGLADKHLQLLLGKPVIDYTFDHVRDSKLLSGVVVSTDSPAVRNRAMAGGFIVVDRPAELATDTASVQGVMLHAIAEYEASWHAPIDAAVILYGNVAVRGQGVIDRAIDHWTQTRCDSVRTFCPVGKWHPRWMSRLSGDQVEPLHPGSIHRRQDLEPLFLHDGAVVVMSRASLMRGHESPDDPHAMFGSDRRGITTTADETVEIDALRDLYWAEAVLRARAVAT
ncbi:MAG: acylneuraminate cytidylyltransferase family protein [Tepidisphaeraceae bacterium]